LPIRVTCRVGFGAFTVSHCRIWRAALDRIAQTAEIFTTSSCTRQ
jgi:hypothetical protein